MADQEFTREIKSIERNAFWFALIGTLVLMTPVLWVFYLYDPLFK